MEFPTSAVYPLSHEDTSLLLSEMQHHSSEMDASRDEIEEGYEINITGDSTLEIAPTHTWSRKVVHAESSVQKRMSDKSRMTNSRTDAPLSPHIDITAEFGPVIDPVINENKDHDDKEYLTADEGSNSIMDTLSDLADGVDNEFDTGNCLGRLFVITFCLMLNYSLTSLFFVYSQRSTIQSKKRTRHLQTLQPRITTISL